MFWGNRPYHTLDWELRNQFGEKVYRLALNGGMTCPNRDGTVGTGGCIFCSAGGSGEFAGEAALSIEEQIRRQKALVQSKRPVRLFIAYFQAYTNTYAPVSYLRRIFTEAISQPGIAALAIATRPDCLPEEVLDLLQELSLRLPVWVELGLQTMSDETARFIRRGYPLSCFEEAVRKLKSRNLTVIVHTILGLPGESRADHLNTMRYLSRLKIDGIKLQLLHVLRGTDLADYYRDVGFPVPSMPEYIDDVIACLEVLSPDIVIHRLTGDGPSDLLIAPDWSLKKRTVLNALHAELKKRGTWQGRLYEP